LTLADAICYAAKKKPDKDALARLSEDAQTWKSLIHTTYFDQPEVVDALADYIAESVGRERGQ
jgi:hypothetical protein